MPVNYKALWDKLTSKKTVEPLVECEPEEYPLSDYTEPNPNAPSREQETVGRHRVDSHEYIYCVSVAQRYYRGWEWSVNKPMGNTLTGCRFEMTDALSSGINALHALTNSDVPYFIQVKYNTI